jgi:hypothetical protein
MQSTKLWKSLRTPGAIGLATCLATTAWAQDAATDTASAPTMAQIGSHIAGGAMNPDVSLDGLFALSQFNRDNPLVFERGHDPHQTGFNIQQVELSFNSNVDPYFRADANLVLTPEGIEIEEAYATTLGLPFNLQVKAGQFFTAFGRHNPTHPHAWDWADKPLVLGRFFGGDGLRNPGAQVAWLSPLPWYSELIASAQNSNGENAVSFNPGGSMRTLGDALVLLRSNNFVSVTDELSVNAGMSYAEAKNNQGPGNRTQIAGGDLFIKYRKPDELSFISLQAEYLQRFYGTADSGQVTDFGWYAQLNYRLPAPYERWHAGLRYDYVGPKNAPVTTAITYGSPTDPDTSRRYRISPVVTFYPSEFSKIRFQYNYDKPQDFENAQQVGIVEFEFLIGAHGAHKF